LIRLDTARPAIDKVFGLTALYSGATRPLRTM
jgi:hypothetical protein